MMRTASACVALAIFAGAAPAQEKFKPRAEGPFAGLTQAEMRRGESAMMPAFKSLVQLNDELLKPEPDGLRCAALVDNAQYLFAMGMKGGAKGSVEQRLRDGLYAVIDAHKSLMAKRDRAKVLEAREILAWISAAFPENEGYRLKKEK
jgi:hypothetical protein